MWSNSELNCIALALKWTTPLIYDNVPTIIDDGEQFESDFTDNDFISFVKSGNDIPSIIDYVDVTKWNNFYRKILLNDFNWFTPITFPKPLPIFKAYDMIKSVAVVGDIIEPFFDGVRSYLKIGTISQMFDEYMLPIKFKMCDIQLPEEFIIDGIIVDDIFYAYDLIPFSDFKRGRCPLAYVDRKDTLNQMIGLFQKEEAPLKIVESRIATGGEQDIIVRNIHAMYDR